MNISRKRGFMGLIALAVLLLLLAACGGTEIVEVPGKTIVVEKEVVVEVVKEVVVEKEVIKEVPVDKIVVVEKEVIKEVVVEKVVVVEKEVIVAATPVPAAPPSKTSVLRIGNTGEVRFTDPAKIQSGSDLITTQLVFARLLQEDPTLMDPRPDIAESWTVSPDGKTYVFKIREDVKFHNGKPLTAQDVEYTWNRCRTQVGEKGWCKGELKDVVSAKATGDYEFTVVIANLSPVFIFSMTHWSLGVVDKDSIDTIDNNPIGTGLYKFVEQVPGDRMVLEKFDGYFDKERLNNAPQRVFLVPIKEAQTRVASLRAGEIDVAVNVPYELLASVAATPGLQLLAQKDGLTSRHMNIIFNTREGPTTDVRVRQAVQLALDKDAINAAIFFDLGVVSCNPILKSHWAYLPVNCPERDVEKAKQLIQEAGYGPGELKLKYYPEPFPLATKMAEVIKQSLAEAGIEMEIIIVDSPTWLDKVWFGVDCSTADWPASPCYAGIHKEFDLGDAWFALGPDPDPLMQSALRSDSARAGFKGDNGMRYFSQDMEDLFELGKGTLDRTVRAKAYRDIVDILVNRDVPLIKLQSTPTFYAANQRIQGAYVNARGYWNSADWTWSEETD